MDRKRLQFYKALFFVYLAALFWILFNRSRYVAGIPYFEQMQQYVNLKPFHTISLYWHLLTDPVRPVLTRLAIYNLAGNILLFLPMGFLIPAIWENFRKPIAVLLSVALLVTTAEILQVLLLAGSCDIDDLILNLLGTALGYPFHKFLIK